MKTTRFFLLLLGFLTLNISLHAQTPDAEGISMHPFVDKSGRDVTLVWNTKTGESKFYYWNSKVSNFSSFEIGLPESPIENPAGSIMMYPYVDKTGRDITLIWDTKTGKSKFYYWNSEVSNFSPFEIGLPENPIENPTGSIMMRPYVDKSERDIILIWDTKTGKSKFYYWNSKVSNFSSFEIGLPDSPMK